MPVPRKVALPGISERNLVPCRRVSACWFSCRYHTRTSGSVAYHLTNFIGPVNLVSIAFLYTSPRRSLRHMPAFGACFSPHLDKRDLVGRHNTTAIHFRLTVRVKSSSRGALDRQAVVRRKELSKCWKGNCPCLHETPCLSVRLHGAALSFTDWFYFVAREI